MLGARGWLAAVSHPLADFLGGAPQSTISSARPRSVTIQYKSCIRGQLTGWQWLQSKPCCPESLCSLEALCHPRHAGNAGGPLLAAYHSPTRLLHQPRW